MDKQICAPETPLRQEKDSEKLAKIKPDLTFFEKDANANIEKFRNEENQPEESKVKKQETFTEMFVRSVMDQTKDYPDPEPLLILHQNGNQYPHRTLKSFSLQQGKQKSKKTTELALEVAAFLKEKTEPDHIYFEPVERGTVLFFDNEQGESYAARTMKLILKLAGVETSDKLKYCDLREFVPNDRLEVIKAGIKATEGVKWVIVDGIVDLMNDFMEAKEGQFIIADLLRLCSEFNIHVTGVLHQNKGQSKDARAHVGSIASQKCEEEIMVEKDPEDNALSVVISKESRGVHFEDFAIRWDKGSLPCIVQDWSKSVSKTTSHSRILQPNEAGITFHLDILKEVFKTDKSPKLGELKIGLQNALSKWHLENSPSGFKAGFSVPVRTVESYRKYYIDEGMVYTTGKTPHTKYNLSE